MRFYSGRSLTRTLETFAFEGIEVGSERGMLIARARKAQLVQLSYFLARRTRVASMRSEALSSDAGSRKYAALNARTAPSASPRTVSR